jgi:hypothetical protein
MRKHETIADLWGGECLKCTFRRTVSQNLMDDCHEVVQLASTISFSGEENWMIWSLTSNGVYSSQSLYKVINFRG